MPTATPDRIRALITERASAHGLSPQLILSQAACESALNPWATRYEAHWKWFVTPELFAAKNHISEATEKIEQMISWGLMQVMGGVARELGHKGHLSEICDPVVGLDLGCKKMKQLIEKHVSLPLALAAYNAGSPNTTAGALYAQKVLATMKG